jgi:lysophospholipase L1-like esterase
LTGTITVAADAFDNVSVLGVQFKLDGVNVGAEDTSAPYSIPLNTAAYSNGNHTLTAVARDAPGLTTTSDPVALAFRNTPPSGFGKVLPLGDSIVYGWTGDAHSEDGGFRRFLWETLAANGMTANTNFVGPTQTGIAGIDRDHDGHNGWRTDQIQGLVAPDFNAYDPALVIVDGGANDLNQGRTVTQALNGLSSLMTAIFAAKPTVKVLLLNYFIPRVNNDYPLIATQIPNFNAGIPSIVSGLVASGRNIELADLTTAGLSTASNSPDFAADGLHPSSAGYSKIAALVYSALTN